MSGSTREQGGQGARIPAEGDGEQEGAGDPRQGGVRGRVRDQRPPAQQHEGPDRAGGKAEGGGAQHHHRGVVPGVQQERIEEHVAKRRQAAAASGIGAP
ncbi:MAG: hypothetical protein RML45_00240 [Acetobacteraceae bacterium]|nr:hypothetical protein [Acetobacteraceae bacterium]